MTGPFLRIIFFVDLGKIDFTEVFISTEVFVSKKEDKMIFKKSFKRPWRFMALLIVLSLIFSGCTRTPPEEAPEQIENPSFILATTTSTQDSGLLDDLLPVFTEDTGIEAKVVAVGTGKALQMGVDGEADVLLVHAKAAEEAFVANGDGLKRFDVMYNDFVVIGPKSDPAGVSEKAPNNVIDAFTAIRETQTAFVSRGDDSGTHKKELSIWDSIGTIPSGDWYVSAGKGMGDVIQMANEMLGYTLTDRATYLSMAQGIEIIPLVEGDERLFNQYGVIAVNPEKNEMINAEGAQAFIDWILSEKAQELIGEYGISEYGEPLFVPNAK